MQYRFYIERDKSPVTDAQNILLSARDVYEINADIDKDSFGRILENFCLYCDDRLSFEPAVGNARTFFRKFGRSDRDIQELESIITLIKPKCEFTVKVGKEFTFKPTAFNEEITCFLRDNVSPYVYQTDTEIKQQAKNSDSEPIIGFCGADFIELEEHKRNLGIKMEIDDLMCVQNYFISESREPSLAEMRIIDSFFSESFRHTTFETILDSVESDDPLVKKAWEHYCEIKKSKNASLSDITRAAAQVLKSDNVVKATNKLSGVKIESADENDKYVLLVKNESHNRSTTAHPYDGAAGSIAGAVKDLLCAFGYAYDAYRVCGIGNTEKSKKKAMQSAAGFAENASTLGITCSKCSENVSPSYIGKQIEVCSVLAVADGTSAEKVFSKEPIPGDNIYIIGARTGKDGTTCHAMGSVDVGEYIPVSHGSELAALQRLFVRKAFADIAVAVNDVGSGGVVCALGEMVTGADIRCKDIKLRYDEGVTFADATLSESNERMIVCVRSENTERLESLCKAEGLECIFVAKVNDSGRFVLYDNEDKRFASLTHNFLFSGGAEKHLSAYVGAPKSMCDTDVLSIAKAPMVGKNPLMRLIGKGSEPDIEGAYRAAARDIRISQSELMHIYDRSAGGNTVGINDKVGQSDISLRKLKYSGKQIIGRNGLPMYSAFSCGSFPELSCNDPYKGGYLSVTDAVLKLVAAGYGKAEIHLSLQEYFPEHKNSSRRLGTSVASMLGVFEAQMQLGVASIGGRISIGSGNKEYDNAATVTAFAFCLSNENEYIESSFKVKGNKIVLLRGELDKDSGLPCGDGLTELSDAIAYLKLTGKIHSAAAVNARSVCTVLMEMSRSGRTGAVFAPECDLATMFETVYGAILCEVSPDAVLPRKAELIGYVADDYRLTRNGEYFELAEVIKTKERRLPRNRKDKQYIYLKKHFDESYGKVKTADNGKPRVIIPMTPFTVAQNDIRAAFEKAGADVRIFRTNPYNIPELVKIIKKSDIMWLGDEGGGAGFLSALLGDKRIAAEIEELKSRGGLIYGTAGAVAAMINSAVLDLDPNNVMIEYGGSDMICEAVRLRVTSTRSPFMVGTEPDDVYNGYAVGKGITFKASEAYLDELARNGRICTQYCNDSNAPLCDAAIDSVISSDGHVLAQMSRPLIGEGYLPIIENMVNYFAGYN